MTEESEQPLHDMSFTYVLDIHYFSRRNSFQGKMKFALSQHCELCNREHFKVIAYPHPPFSFPEA